MPKKTTSRRQFLTGQSAAEALADLTHGTGDAALPAGANRYAPAGTQGDQEPGGRFLIQVARQAMACEFEVFLNAGQAPHGAELAVEALDLVARLEEQLTVYNDESEVSMINLLADQQPRDVEPGLFALLQLARELYEQTGGAFDITAGPLSKVWGFYRRQGRVPAPDDLAEARSHVGSHLVRLDPNRLTVELDHAGVEINLGAIGKGYALDRCAQQLLEAGVADFLIHGGQSSVLAWGTQLGAPHGEKGWSVGLRHPLRPERRLAEIMLRGRAMGTSGTGTQSFHHQGRRYGHILDPRTGQPAEGVYSATVLAPTAAEADALATAFYVMGPEVAVEHCRGREELSMIMVCPGASTGSIRVVQAGMKEQEWKLLETA